MAFYNGDDAVLLLNTNTGDTLDIIGQIGVDPGSGWPVGTGATNNYTLIRNIAIQGGNTNWTTAQTEWDVYPIDMMDSLGTHSAVACLPIPTGCSTDLFFSEYIEGSSSNKALEISNPTSNTIDLSDYVVYRYNNGSFSATDSLYPQGMLDQDSVFVVANPSANAGILAEEDTTHTLTFYNGDDAVLLLNKSTGDTLDIIGQIGANPGSGWPVGTGATNNYTLIRNINVQEGNTDWTSAVTEWDVYPIDMVDSIGSHSMTPCAGCSNTFSIISDTACDIYSSPSGLHSWTSSGTYFDTIPNAALCDSIIQVVLTINYSSIDTIYPVACDFYISPSGNHTWSNSGIYYDTNPSIAGCDSVLQIILNITNIDTAVFNMTPTLIAADTTSGTTYQWLDCNNFYAEISGETGQSFTATTSGSYSVEITNGACVDTSACYPILISSVANIFDNEVQIYPNPSNGKFSIDFGRIETANIRIYSIEGKTIYQQNYVSEKEITFDIDLDSGMYFLEVSNGTLSKSFKLLIE